MVRLIWTILRFLFVNRGEDELFRPFRGILYKGWAEFLNGLLWVAYCVGVVWFYVYEIKYGFAGWWIWLLLLAVPLVMQVINQLISWYNDMVLVLIYGTADEEFVLRRAEERRQAGIRAARRERRLEAAGPYADETQTDFFGSDSLDDEEYERQRSSFASSQGGIPAGNGYTEEIGEAYKALGLSYPATKNQVRLKYFDLSMNLHPDKLTDASEPVRAAATEKFLKVKDAYELICQREAWS